MAKLLDIKNDTLLIIDGSVYALAQYDRIQSCYKCDLNSKCYYRFMHLCENNGKSYVFKRLKNIAPEYVRFQIEKYICANASAKSGNSK